MLFNRDIEANAACELIFRLEFQLRYIILRWRQGRARHWYIRRLQTYLGAVRAVGSRWVLAHVVQSERESPIDVEQKCAVENDAQFRNLWRAGERQILNVALS